jgi:hypothetical protein
VSCLARPSDAGDLLMPINEKREFTRVPFKTEVKLSASGKTIISNKLQNVSLGGAFISSDETFPPGTMCLLEIKLTSPATLLKIGIEAKVVRTEENGIGVKFSRMDVDSLIHLRHIVRIQSGDPKEVDLEYNQKLLQID